MVIHSFKKRNSVVPYLLGERSSLFNSTIIDWFYLDKHLGWINFHLYIHKGLSCGLIELLQKVFKGETRFQLHTFLIDKHPKESYSIEAEVSNITMSKWARYTLLRKMGMKRKWIII